MSSFRIPSELAPLWSDPTAPHRPISEQVDELLTSLSNSGQGGAVRSVLQGLKFIDRAAVHDEYTDAREWEIASVALRQVLLRDPPGDATTLFHALVDQMGHAARYAEEPESFKGEPVGHAVSKTHQRDNNLATQWDAERCAAASTVAALAFGDRKALTKLAQQVKRELQADQRVLAGAAGAMRSGDPARMQAARAEALHLMAVLVDALDLRPVTVLERQGYAYGDGQGPGVFLDPADPSGGFWVRDGDANVHHVSFAPQGAGTVVRQVPQLPEAPLEHLTPPADKPLQLQALANFSFPTEPVSVDVMLAPATTPGESRPIERTSVSLDTRPFATMSALAALVGAEAQLYDDAVGVVDGELARLRYVQPKLERTPQAGALQVLADTLLFAGRNLSTGLNHGALEALLQEAGIAAQAPADGVARPLKELAERSQPGEAYLLAGAEHAVAYLHLADGRRMIYDSEGIFRLKERVCLATYDPENAPRRSAALARDYASFYGMLQLPLGPSLARATAA